ncbi:hypothetical protein [Bradyrhizobium sp. 164]|uniref:hypothetical protein n=1 Tax=Bradyrhizobium sp. 164 TaxID=2782637 RepID=UPI001FF8FCFD|nr:hypothetical protein [Bradyrhizobium sp. 164]MCK1593349.1 hypothetical protein [Bradyrhizobium sp. 164]
MDLGLNDMKYTLEATHRVYQNARKPHDELMAREFRRLDRENDRSKKRSQSDMDGQEFDAPLDARGNERAVA